MAKIIGDRKFYKYIFSLMIPILVQNAITNFVAMLDNLMVGRLGTAPMSGVAIANQLIFIYNLCIFGAVAGAGIFGAQFIGRKDYDNFRNTFKFKVLFCLGVACVGTAILLGFGKDITNLFLKGEGEKQQAARIVESSTSYIKIMVIGFFPFCISQVYSSSLRETGNTKEPMIASMIAVFVNLGLNYVLIFGRFGFPRMGVRGAAIATVISRFVGMFYLVIITHLKQKYHEYFAGVYKKPTIPVNLVKQIIKMSLPLLLNETLWALGLALTAQSYSLRGQSVVAANSITNTFWEVFGVAFIAVGVTVSIVVGQLLGAAKYEEAKESAYKLIFLSFITGVCMGLIYALCAKFIPELYNSSAEVKQTAFRLILIDALLMPFDAIAHSTYFTLRSGGKVWITLAFDSGFAMLVVFPIAFILSRYTALSIYWVFLLSKGAVIIKGAIGTALARSKIWIKTLGKDV